MTVKDRFHGVLGLSEIEHCVPRCKISSRMENGECAQISAHPCKSTASTSDDHNFLVQTPIPAFLDSMERSLSLKFNKIKCSAKTWVEHRARSQIVEEWFVLVFGTSVFGIGCI